MKPNSTLDTLDKGVCVHAADCAFFKCSEHHDFDMPTCSPNARLLGLPRSSQ